MTWNTITALCDNLIQSLHNLINVRNFFGKVIKIFDYVIYKCMQFCEKPILMANSCDEFFQLDKCTLHLRPVHISPGEYTGEN